MKGMIPKGYCQCGCGQKTNLAPQTDLQKGRVNGEPMRYIAGHNSRGTSNPRYNYGLTFDRRKRRWLIRCRDGSHTEFYRAVMEKELKRVLRSNEIVHHINGDSTDDRPENLQLFSGRGEHTSIGHYGNTTNHLLTKLHEYVITTGHRPTIRKAKRCKWMPCPSAYQRRFGSWNNALKEAGLL